MFLLSIIYIFLERKYLQYPYRINCLHIQQLDVWNKTTVHRYPPLLLSLRLTMVNYTGLSFIKSLTKNRTTRRSKSHPKNFINSPAVRFIQQCCNRAQRADGTYRRRCDSRHRCIGRPPSRAQCENRASCGRASTLLSSSLIRAVCVHPPGCTFDFRRLLPFPSRPLYLTERYIVCTKHLARASSCLYVAAYTFPLLRSSLSPCILDIIFSLSFPFSLLSYLFQLFPSLFTHIHASQLLYSGYSPDVSFHPSLFPLHPSLFRVPNKISISDIFLHGRSTARGLLAVNVVR